MTVSYAAERSGKLRVHPVYDRARMAVVEGLSLSGHAGIAGLDAAIKMLAASCAVPMAVVNIVRPQLQTYPAEVGVGAPCTRVPDELSFCSRVVETGRLLRVADARLHPVYRANPLVRSGHVRAYAGVPLVHQGVVVGAVSIFDCRPRRFGGEATDSLWATAEIVEEMLDLRRSARRDPHTGAVTVSSDTAPSIADRADVEARLAAAVDEGALEVAFQPIVDARDGAVTSIEALVRWPAAPPGVTPSAFIELAEGSDLIIALGTAVLDMTCARLAAWRERYAAARRLRIWVNASPRELDRAGYVDHVADVLARYGLPPEALGVEVTETTTSLDRWQTIDTLAALRSVGVNVALDDFGTGYSSLGRLHRLPVDRLKLDRSFVAALDPNDERSAAYVKAVVELGRALGLIVVAEGVETLAERQIVEALGCDAMQGFLFHRPTPADDLPAALAWQPDVGQPPHSALVTADRS